MPTGYTYPVVEGKITEFPDFAMTCARAFGALITMRDERSDAPIPETIEPSTDYYDKAIAEAEANLTSLQAMNASEVEGRAKMAHKTALASRATYLANKELEAERINAMLAKVRAWQPPTPDHVEMKKFMIDQLVVSLPGDYAPAIPEMQDGETWRAKEIKDAAETLARNKVERAKEIERANGRTQWLKSLRSSLAA